MNGSPVHGHELQSMCETLIHRGPDDAGYHLERGVGLAMRRLSIIDLETGHQPVYNEDRSVVVVLNGEIYNYKSLREDLERRGHAFYTETDTETIVHLYEEFGIDCVNRLRGMFAFALWDGRNGILLLARDRLGIKPLYYGKFNGRLVFASEIKAILQLPEVPRDLNWQSVGHYFSGLCTPAAESILTGVHKLEPGSTLMVSIGGRTRLSRYWEVRFQPDYTHDENYFADRLLELMEESVRLHLVSHVPVGAFLSGGMDSSSVVALMTRMSDLPVRTFSIGFREDGYDETVYARRVADQFGTEHNELILNPDVEELAGELAWYLDEPLGDSSAIPTYMVSKLAADQVKVVLSGDGGDELFAGYDKYRVEQKERHYELIPAALRRGLGLIGEALPEGAKGRNFLRHIALSGPRRYLDAGMLFKDDQKYRLFHPDIRTSINCHDHLGDQYAFLTENDEDWLSAMQHLDLERYLPLDILTKVDRMSMANSIEARVPLLDHKLVEFALTIPPEFRLRKGETKSIFKRAMRGILPDEVIERRKQGFAAPFRVWLRRELASFVREILLAETCARRRILNTDYILNLLTMHEAGRDLSMQLWALVSFELWCRTFMDGEKRSAVPVARPSAFPAMERPVRNRA
jgi:asparagine synthase (glutamine-hydrolysing)